MRDLSKWWLAFGLVSALGCGDSDGAGGDPVFADAGRDAGKDEGPPIVRVDSGTAMTMEQEFMCEATMCTVPEIDTSSLMLPAIMGVEITPELIESMGFGPMGCCVDGDKCGVTQEMLFGAGFCAEQDQEGEPNPDCPDEEADIMGLLTVSLEGCCRFDNKCGVNLDLIGVGCVEREEASMIQIAGMSLPNAEDIMSIDCTFSGGGTDGGVDDDAGAL